MSHGCNSENNWDNSSFFSSEPHPSFPSPLSEKASDNREGMPFNGREWRKWGVSGLPLSIIDDLSIMERGTGGSEVVFSENGRGAKIFRVTPMAYSPYLNFKKGECNHDLQQ